MPRIEPTLPMLRMLPVLPMLKIEQALPMLRIDPMLKILLTLPKLRTLRKLLALSRLTSPVPITARATERLRLERGAPHRCMSFVFLTTPPYPTSSCRRSLPPPHAPITGEKLNSSILALAFR